MNIGLKPVIHNAGWRRSNPAIKSGCPNGRLTQFSVFFFRLLFAARVNMIVMRAKTDTRAIHILSDVLLVVRPHYLFALQKRKPVGSAKQVCACGPMLSKVDRGPLGVTSRKGSGAAHGADQRKRKQRGLVEALLFEEDMFETPVSGIDSEDANFML